MKANDLSRLQSTIISEARSAFRQLAVRVKSETVYGFALYTDDSLTGIDAAVNTLEQFNSDIARPRTNGFESYWYTIAWRFEGGVAEYFDRTNAILGAYGNLLENDDFRQGVIDIFLNAMPHLISEGFFGELSNADDPLFQVSITDSDADTLVMERSIRELNPPSVWDRYLKEKETFGY